MYASLPHFSELQKSQIDTINAVFNSLVSATESLANLNLKAARNLVQDANQTTMSLVGSKGPQEALVVFGGLMQPAAENLVNYSRDLYGIACGTSAEISRILDSQFIENSGRFSELMEGAFRNAPTGSEAAVSFLKSAISTSNSAYDAVSKAAKKAAELAEATMPGARAGSDDGIKAKVRKAA